MEQQKQKECGIVVAARIRPFNNKEISETDGEAVPIVESDGHGKVTLIDGSSLSEKTSFVYDYVFSAFKPSVELLSPSGGSDEEDELAARSQEEIFEELGHPIVTAAWDGYNGCIFAYGQTSSGKTYTMMGTKRDPGVIPRLCRSLFEKIEADEAEDGKDRRRMTKCTVSYMEIYNEQVRDLLKTRPKDKKMKFATRFDTKDVEAEEYQQLKVRQHPIHGPFVDGITKLDVDNWLECVKLIRLGNEARSSCATAMNDQSSRSHAIFQIMLTQTEALGARVRGKEVTNHKVSKINLVDLAGSERITKTNVTGKHMAEANYINQSLSTLRKVFEALISKSKKPTSVLVVPYRESMLTWILSDNFGGNSRTVMIANVSPHQSNQLETESTLRYGTLAKGIVNRIRVNEDPSTKLIRELQAQLKALQDEVTKHSPGSLTSPRSPLDDARLQELELQMEENRRAMDELHSREESMRMLIQESRMREERLLVERENLASSEEKWRKEAQRLLKEKEELQETLFSLTQSNPHLLSKHPDASAFWSSDSKGTLGADDIAVRDPNAEASKIVEEACPPQKRSSFRRTQKSMIPSEAISPEPQQIPKASVGSTPLFGRRSAQEKAATPTPTPTSGSGPRAGRRANTSESATHPEQETTLQNESELRVPPWRKRKDTQ